MRKLLFPFQLQLHILQLEEYDLKKFILWISSHFLTRSLPNKKPLVWTAKAKLLYYLTILSTFLLIVLLTVLLGLLGLLLGLLFATQPYIFFILSSVIIFPYEVFTKRKIKSVTEAKLQSLSKLKIIGITGSYGKTSVKEFLYQILRTQFSVLKTPESYNTPYGIAKVVDLELDDSYDYFICEMGAYKRGDIKEICDMVHPTYGILTGINEQHIETFGSLENTTKGKFELIDSLPKNSIGVVNIDNERIRQRITFYNNKQLIPYGFTDTKFTIHDISQTTGGTSFTLFLDDKGYKAQTVLLGKAALQNILAAATMSYLLGMKPQAIVKAIETIEPVSHRLEIKDLGNMTLIDDAYNSNVDGFTEAIQLLNSFKSSTILVTPGIVGLGNQTASVHQSLGKLLNNIDYIFLVGKSERTENLKKEIIHNNHVFDVNSLPEVWKKIEALSLKHPVVLLENDLPDNY